MCRLIDPPEDFNGTKGGTCDGGVAGDGDVGTLESDDARENNCTNCNEATSHVTDLTG